MEDRNVEPKKDDLSIDIHTIRKGNLVLRAINHKVRQQILKVIHERQKVTVTEIYVKLRLEQSVASQHLAILRKARFVDNERKGKNIHYSINYERLEQVNKIVTEVLIK